METKNCSELNNIELKEYSMTLENEFEATKAKIKLLCEELSSIEKEYEKAQNELRIRRTVY